MPLWTMIQQHIDIINEQNNPGQDKIRNTAKVNEWTL